MRYKINNFEYLKILLTECSKDCLSDPWDVYPCILWDRGKHTRGYGVIRDPRSTSLEHKRAHVLAYELYHGNKPAGTSICHRCDNPSCIRPIHLFSGTHLENVQDCMSKGRGNRAHDGEENGNRKLSEESVLAIRRLYRSGVTTRKIGEWFGVSSSNVSSIGKRKTWDHI